MLLETLEDCVVNGLISGLRKMDLNVIVKLRLLKLS
jgi:hypothetical protein